MELQELYYILLILINSHSGMRLLYCLIKYGTSQNDSERGLYKTRAKNLLWFICIANSCASLLGIVIYQGYFNGGNWR